MLAPFVSPLPASRAAEHGHAPAGWHADLLFAPAASDRFWALLYHHVTNFMTKLPPVNAGAAEVVGGTAAESVKAN
jgi:hypothetical protein